MISVLHIGHSRKWRGGENQVRLLIEDLNEVDISIESHIAYPQGAFAITRLLPSIKNYLPLASTRPYDIRSMIAIIRYCKNNGIDIIDAQSANAHTLAFYAALFLPSVKLVVHRRVDNRIKKTVFTRIKYLSSRVDYWVAISEKIAGMLKEYGVDKRKIIIIRSSTDSRLYINLDKPKAKLGFCTQFNWQPGTPLIGFAGSLDGQKNPLLFVDIIDQLRQAGIHVNGLIAGSGKLTNQVNIKINSLRLSDHLKQLGFVENMTEYFSALDIFVLPSRNEGLGTVLLEAINARCAIVASDVGGIGEVIIDHQTGRLADSTSLASFVDGIKDILGESNNTQKMKTNALQHVRENFSLANTIADTAKLYQDIINYPN